VSEGWLQTAFAAVREGDLAEFAALLETSPDSVSELDDSGMTLLHLAAERDEVGAVRLLIEHGADMEAEAVWGQTPFEWAANMNAEKSAATLLKAGSRGPDLWTGAALGLVEVVERAFLGHEETIPSAPARLKNGSGRTAPPAADLEGWPADCAVRLGDHVSDAFYIACRNGRQEVARLLLDRGAEVDAVGYFGATALHWAAGGGHGDVALWLIESGADATRRDPKFGSDAAGWARESGYESLAERLDQHQP
jgi:hypothetical protein